MKDQGKRTVVSDDFVKHGYRPEAEIMIWPERGVYYVTLWLNEPNGERREVPFEPAEPELQKIGVEWADREPIAAVLQAIEIDKAMREDERNA